MKVFKIGVASVIAIFAIWFLIGVSVNAYYSSQPIERQHAIYQTAFSDLVARDFTVKAQRQHFTEELSARLSDDNLQKSGAVYNKLGDLKSYGALRHQKYGLSGTTPSAEFNFDAVFEKGGANVHMLFEKHTEKWLISAMTVSIAPSLSR